MVVTLAKLDDIKKLFSKSKIGKKLTEDTVRTSICDYTEGLLNKENSDNSRMCRDLSARPFRSAAISAGTTFRP